METVKKNSASLKELRPEQVPQPYVGVIRAADDLLTHLLKCMNPGDKYYAITHLHTWTEDRLPLLWAQTKLAAERGVTVQRIFNLVRDCKRLNRADVKTCLTKHARLAALPNTGYEAKTVQESEDFPQYEREGLEHAHSVLIEQGESVITIEVLETDLSELRLSTNKNRFNEEKARFNVLWNNAALLNKALVDDIIRNIYGS